MTDRARRPTTANPRYVVTPPRGGQRRGYDPGQIAAVKLAIKHARYVPTLADGEARRIAEEHGCQSARKTDPLSASKIDPSYDVEIRA